MKTRIISLILIQLFSGVLVTRAAEPSELLAEGLVAEEVRRDPVAAAGIYEKVLEGFAEHQTIAATALFRLAEVRRKQDRKEDAIALYQQLIREFPAAGAETKLARENLTALGAPMEPPAQGIDPFAVDPEDVAIAELRELLRTSPDVALAEEQIDLQVTNNRPRVLTFLLEAGAKAAPGLEDAVRSGNLEMVNLLLRHCGDDAVEEKSRALRIAAGEEQYPSIAKALLAAGADPHYRIPGHTAGATIFTEVIRRLSLELVKVFLEAKVDPRVGLPSGFTPLHLLALRACDDKERILLAGRLLELGADINARSLLFFESASNLEQALRARSEREARTPLALAISNRQWDYARYLIGKGADAKDPMLWDAASGQGTNPISDEIQLEGFRFLLDQGADPNAGIGSSSMPAWGPFLAADDKRLPTDTPLLLAGTSVPVIKLLLERGAKPDEASLGKLLSITGEADIDGSLFRSLLGDSPPPLVNPGADFPLSRFTPAAREVYLERVLIPHHVAKDGIRWLDADTGQGKEVDLRIPEGGAALDEVLRKISGEIQRKLVGQQALRRWPDLSLHTTENLAGTKLDVKADGPWPTLANGSVILVRTSPDQAPDEAKFNWHLARRQSIDIQFTLDGQTRGLKLQGGMVSFDITGNKAPLVPAGVLARLIGAGLDPNGQPDDLADAEIEIHRKEWAPVNLRLDDPAANGFQLQDGDHLHLRRGIANSWQTAMENARAKEEPMTRIAVAVPGYPFLWIHDGFAYTEDPKPVAVLPSLVQVLAEIQSGQHEIFRGLTNGETIGSDSLAADAHARFLSTNGNDLPVVFLIPDLSKIRIRRSDGKGGELILEVDLQKAIDANTPETTAARARESDVQLQPGDIVLLQPEKEKTKANPTGMEERQTRFFTNILGGRILAHGAGSVTHASIDYRPAIWHETPGGWIAIPPEHGNSSVRITAVLTDWRIEESIPLERDGKRHNVLGGRFLFPKDGDKIGKTYSPMERRNSRPRPRIIAPPQRSGD